jgi:hypothetical protein
VSSLNLAAGVTSANRATVPVDAAAPLLCLTSSTPVNVVLDLQAWILAPGPTDPVEPVP